MMRAVRVHGAPRPGRWLRVAVPAGAVLAAGVMVNASPTLRGLLVTLEYPAHEKAGPPFSVPEAEVRDLFGRDWRIDVLVRRDILDAQPGFVAEGVSSLHTVAYRLERR